MEFEKIKDLMKDLDKSNLMDFELRLNDGFYLRMNKYNSPSSPKENNIQITENISIPQSPNTTQNIDKIEENEKPQNNKETEGNLVLSPIVGTFYSSSSPSKPAYVKVGDKVKAGDVLCIIEAMKVMNEITCQYSGEIVAILVENEDMVEYNQPLFRIV